ncbi:hypothetical protein [Flavobacterium sp.]|uniref:hypothetical protein n=1 Tax=Flavobacterium sp. TaxID=239 RepID=UPI002B4B4DC5|nr:hypothetical protein [Flavobacterium sp.]HLP64040.1 hypothetical protein [Flavobacterium sp.]
MKKQVVSFFLLFVLIVPIGATYLWLHQRKRAVKKEIKWKMIAGLDKKELVYFAFSQKDIESKLRWEHSKEFEYKHQMYDVVEKKITNDSVHLWCWWDFEETKLNKQLQSLLTVAFQNDTKTTQKREQTFGFYKLLYFQPEFSWEPFVYSSVRILSNYKKIIYQSIPSLISLPPPKVSIS